MEPLLNRTAESRGFTRAVLRTDQFVHPVAGVSLLAAHQDDLASTCRAAALVLPSDSVFTHLTAARLRGWWLPELEGLPLIACTDGDAAHHDRRGVYVRRCAIPAWHRMRIGDVAVASAAWTVVELAEHLSFLDLVVAIDGALHLGHVSVEDIRSTMVPGRRGVRGLRRALDVCDPRSESPWETVLRLLHVLSGIEVESQFLVENRAGVVIARSDLRIKGTRRLPEYDGSGHRDRAQHERDLRRDKKIAREGYERFGYIASEILRDPARIIRDADEALGRPFDPNQLSAWRREVAASAFSARGLAALEQRLARFARPEPPRRRGNQ